MAVPTHCCVIVMLTLTQGQLGSRKCAQCRTCALANLTARKALLTPFYERTRPNGQ